MDRSPNWFRLLSASACTVGLVATLAGPAPHRWQPAADETWLWPTSPASVSDRAVDVVVLDPFSTAEHEVAGLHAAGYPVVCQLRAGVWEAGRPDTDRLDPSLIGGSAAADARWLDVRRLADLTEALDDRFALCAGKGFDGVALADLDGYAHPTGFPLTEGDQLRFNTALATLARHHGLRVAVVATRWTPVPSTVDVLVSPPRFVAGVGSAGRSTRTGS
jgi:hypothetical protein